MIPKRKVGTAVFAAMVATALGFGAHEALADARGDACASPSIGTCGTRAQCLKNCAEAFPGGLVVNGWCSSGCCYCEVE